MIGTRMVVIVVNKNGTRMVGVDLFVVVMAVGVVSFTVVVTSMVL